MIATMLLLMCHVCGSDSGSPSQVEAFRAAYVRCGSPEGEALARRERGLDTVLDAIERHCSVSGDTSGSWYSEEETNCILSKVVDLGLVVPLVSFGNQLEDFSDAQKDVAAGLGGEVHHGNKYWYRETLYRVIDAKEAYYDTLLGSISEPGAVATTLC
ncbi:UNVERIFIED_CONTAM: hypothetical protein PYX00_011401 [Menopon gallinae]|uniref:Uncharacterized protein n=1 Tax=Menopon gallinae TaxID=328185 RepID=A0AAW2H7J8_9NEOP